MSGPRRGAKNASSAAAPVPDAHPMSVAMYPASVDRDELAHAGGGAIGAGGGVAGGIGRLSCAGSVVVGATTLVLDVVGAIVVATVVDEDVVTTDVLDCG